MMAQVGVHIDGKEPENGLEQAEDSFGDARRSSNYSCYYSCLNTVVLKPAVPQEIPRFESSSRGCEGPIIFR